MFSPKGEKPLTREYRLEGRWLFIWELDPRDGHKVPFKYDRLPD